MKKILLLLFFSYNYFFAVATHNRAGEITYEELSPYHYRATVVTYTKTSSNIDRPFLELFWGDGNSDSIPRINQVQVGPDITKNTYQYNHSYNAPGTYLMHMEDMNRNGGVVNIPNSVNTSFYIETMLQINPFLGFNNSPILTNPPIDQGCVNQPFIHNPGAYDPDGDSLSYELFVCRGAGGIPCPGYFYPPAVISFTLDPVSGDLVWNYPDSLRCGEWNVAFLIREWREGVNIGYVERDMQITINCPCPNNPPLLITANDTCVEAGTFISLDATATDPDNDDVIISASGGPFLINPDSAYLSPQPSVAPWIRTFYWQTQCHHVRKAPYAVLFKAEDNHPNPALPANPPNFNLAAFKTVNITVVAPAPQNPAAFAVGNSIHLSWDKSICDQASGYYIYRRNGFYGFIHGPCETGVPAYTGYAKIADVAGVNNLTYIDNNNGSGLINGIDYCYMVVAYFSDGGESYASVEVCAQLKRDLPVITNASVNATGTANGSIYVAWSKPTELDTVQIPGPYKYVLYHSNNFTGNNFSVVDSFFDLDDTIYIDTLINTVNTPWSYKVEFYNLTTGSEFKIGQTQIASTIFLTTSATDLAVILNWKENVPWTNISSVIYRKNAAGVFDSIGTTSQNTFRDTGLINGTEYCYKIKTIGHYSASGFVDPVINFSQEKCEIPFDNVPPCIPVFSVKPDCGHNRNILTWKFSNTSCPNDVGSFNIYHANDSTADLELIATIYNGSDTMFIDDSLPSIAGCYKITAVDTNHNESGFSAKVCVDNCPVYELPNVFTPNGDGMNDLFHPFPYSYVKDIDIRIYDRWGLIMYKTTDPDVNWNGTLNNKGKLCPDGVYYYLCTVNEIYINGIRPRLIKGYVQLLRNR